MSGSSNHNKKKLLVRPDQTIEGTSFEGIIPDPETLEQLEKLSPGCTNKWMELAASEIKSRQKNEDRITWTFKNSTIIGQILGFISSALVLGVGTYALYLGYPAQAAIIITGSAAAVIMAYFARSRNKN